MRSSRLTDAAAASALRLLCAKTRQLSEQYWEVFLNGVYRLLQCLQLLRAFGFAVLVLAVSVAIYLISGLELKLSLLL